MNINFQTIGVIIIGAIAIGFLVKKYFFKTKSKKACGDDGCGC
jgi:hypothetical protein